MYHWPPETWLSFAMAVAAVGYLIVSYRMWKLQESVESARGHIELAVDLGKGQYDSEGSPMHDQDWIEVTNSSPTGVRLTAITIQAERQDKALRDLTQPSNELVQPFSKKRINVYSEMSRVVGPLTLDDKRARAKGRVSITLQYKAHGNTFSTQPAEFLGEFAFGEFFTGLDHPAVHVSQPPAKGSS